MIENVVTAENQSLIDAVGAVPVVDGVAYVHARKFEVGPYKVKIYMGLHSGEAIKEFDINKVTFLGWPAEITPGETFQEG